VCGQKLFALKRRKETRKENKERKKEYSREREKKKLEKKGQSKCLLCPWSRRKERKSTQERVKKKVRKERTGFIDCPDEGAPAFRLRIEKHSTGLSYV